MKKFSNLEESVRHSRPKRTRFLLSAGLASLFLGGLLFYVGVRSVDSSLKISADTSESTSSSAVLPPVPAEPVRDTSPTTGETKTFLSGWSMIPGSGLEGLNLKALGDAGLILYSFNDPAFPNRNWSTYPTAQTSSTNIIPAAPLGYYVYNPNTDKAVTFAKSTATAKPNNYMFARGWHILYWPNALADKNQFMSSVKLTYSDGSSETLAAATSQDKHMASVKIYVINNEKSAEEGSIKELTGEDSTTTISKVPQNSYFWIYLRRTKDRVVNITIGQ